MFIQKYNVDALKMNEHWIESSTQFGDNSEHNNRIALVLNSNESKSYYLYIIFSTIPN